MSDYAEATRDWDPLDVTLRQAYRPEQQAEETVYLPAVRPEAPLVVHQPAPLPEPAAKGGVDLMSVRILATGGGIGMAGAGVDLAGHGIAVAGPYLWALAGALAALAGLIALIKGQTSSSSGGTSVTISGGKNRIGRIG
jgi:hypothetical protein